MGVPEFTPGSPENPSESKQVALLIEIARAQVDEAYKVSELLESKARALLQASTVFFATSQAAIGIQLAARSGQGTTPWWVAVLAAIIGVSGLLGVGLTARRTIQLQSPEDQKTVDVVHLRDSLFHFAAKDDSRVPRFVFEMLTSIVTARRKANAEKALDLAKVRFWSWVALGSSGLALLLGIVTSLIQR